MDFKMSSLIIFSKSKLEKLKKLLKKACITGNVRLYRVVQALIYLVEKDKALSYTQIAHVLNVTRKTIFNWVLKFMSGGFYWLENDPFKFSSRGRPAKLNKAQKTTLFEMIKEGPEKNGFYSGVWTCAMIQELIFIKFGVKYNSRYLSTYLKKMGLSYQKAKFIPAKCDEEKYIEMRKKWLEESWPRILKKAKDEKAIIMFGDEVSFAMWGSLSRTWGVIGQQPEVKTKGCRKGLKMFGAIGFNQGEFIYMESLAYTLVPKAFKQLIEDGVCVEQVNKIKVLKNVKYENKDAYLNALEELIGKDDVKKHEPIWLKYTETAGKFNGENYVKFLQKLIDESDSKVILVEDGAPYHGSNVVKDYVKSQSERLELERLPSFSPDFNPIEKLWKNTKRDATHCKYFETFEKLRESVINAFENYLHDASKVVCVMKKMREEAIAINLL